eukprot:CAMPEP_0114520938 /NCGR_PEP_ID=MMETSP0109-20121206/19902_1 /TAXON_ID=29199 /ORGANISM="Chlorarachnion reptans, Strain CCCM449" /LENGTH=457 /DNA_ID=CAMNT_0001701975 /DNA_START=330 /DNA_END=1699 /DNA_ORIENTATION=-
MKNKHNLQPRRSIRVKRRIPSLTRAKGSNTIARAPAPNAATPPVNMPQENVESGLPPTQEGTQIDRNFGIVPGVVAAAALMQASFGIADILGMGMLELQGLDPGGKSPLSGIPVAILLGAGIRSSLGLSKSLEPGIKFATTSILRAGIICVGAKLSAAEMVELGAAGVPAVIASISAGMLFVNAFGSYMKLPPRLSSLIAAGTSICGVTAIAALSPAINATQKEVSYAVANVVVFGTLGMLAYPYLANHLFEYSEQVGIFLGLSIHDTSQVMAAALTYNEVFNDELAMKTAAITKLTRNVFLAAVIPTLAWHSLRNSGEADPKDGGSGKKKGPINMTSLFKKCFPLFVLGFIAMGCARTVGDMMIERGGKAFGYFEKQEWKDLANRIGNDVGGRFLLGTAMAGVGLNTSLATFREGGLGIRPFIVGSTGALVVGLTGACSVYALANYGILPTEKKEA